jgi:hypothetical protein
MNADGSVDFTGFRTLPEFQEKNRTAGTDHLAKGLSICRGLGLDRKYGYNPQAIRTAAK